MHIFAETWSRKLHLWQKDLLQTMNGTEVRDSLHKHPKRNRMYTVLIRIAEAVQTCIYVYICIYTVYMHRYVLITLLKKVYSPRAVHFFWRGAGPGRFGPRSHSAFREPANIASCRGSEVHGRLEVKLSEVRKALEGSGDSSCMDGSGRFGGEGYWKLFPP